jgi:hypothetical protein
VSFQSTTEFVDVLGGRTLRLLPEVVQSSKTDRPLSVALIDVDSGELLSIHAQSGALEAGLVPMPEEAPSRHANPSAGDQQRS